MRFIDIFNGDADGICALHQLRLDNPQPTAQLITGVKRDNSLLQKVTDIQGASITVLDISFDKNRRDAERLLGLNNRITYIDHHFSGEIIEHEHLITHIDPNPKTCTSLLVDSLLKGKFSNWAIAGAFGDNLDDVAVARAQEAGLDEEQVGRLREIGRLLNYNGYGSSLEDLFIAPEALFLKVHQYRDPFDFYQTSSTLKTLQQGYKDDMARAEALKPLNDTATSRVFQLPAERWARRVVGVFSNQIAWEQPDKAHATLVLMDDGHCQVSVRAPLAHRFGADSFCNQFATGGGRAAAAGINSLPAEKLDYFLTLFHDHFPVD